MANLDFDASQVEPAEPFSVIPAGKYLCQVVNSEMRPTKDGGGAYLWLELEILDGEFKGRKVFDRLNLENQNQQAVDIARRALSALCHAVGELQVKDSEQLHFKPFVATVRMRPASDGYDASNEVRGYAPADGKVVPIAAPAAAKPAAAPVVKTPPWRAHKQ
jgi:hypothetical protein